MNTYAVTSPRFPKAPKATRNNPIYRGGQWPDTDWTTGGGQRVDSINTDGQEEAVFMPSAEARSEGEMVQEALEFQRLIKLAQSFFTPEYMQDLAQSRDLNLEESAIEISALMAILGLLEDYLAKAAEDAEERAFLKPILGEVNEWEANAEKLVPELYKQNMKPVFVKAFSEIPNLKTDILTYMMQHVSAWAAGEALRILDVNDVASEAFSNAYKQIASNHELVYNWLANALSNYCSEWARSILDEAEKLNLNLKALRDLIGFKPDQEKETTGAETYLSVPSGLYTEMQRIVATQAFNRVEGTEWPTAIINKFAAKGTAQLRPPFLDENPFMPPEQVTAMSDLMWTTRNQLSDLDVDVMDALSAIYLQQTTRPEEDATTSIDDILNKRGLKPKKGGSGTRGGYTLKQRQEVLAALGRIQSIWMNAELDSYEETTRGGRKRARKVIQSRPFVITDVITDRMGQMRAVKRFIFRPGKVFAHYLHGPGRQTALLNAVILKFDPYRQPWEKRLGRYLTSLFRIRARNGAYLDGIRVQTLLEQTGDELNSRRGAAIREHLETALDTLQSNGIIRGWQYDNWSEPAATNRRWFKTWLQALVIIEPPATVQEHYQQIADKVPAPKNITEPAESIGTRIKEKRLRLNLSQQQAAEDIGISASYLSLLERGKRGKKINPDIMTKVSKWLDA
jgi:DNA-binding XRE family transcriptional regulator